MSTVTPLPPIPTPAIVPPIQTTQLILNTPSLTIPSPRVGPTLIPTSQSTQDPPSPSNPVPTPRVGSTLIPVFQSETIKRQTTLTTNNTPITPRNKIIVVFPSLSHPLSPYPNFANQNAILSQFVLSAILIAHAPDTPKLPTTYPTFHYSTRAMQ